MSNTKYTDPTNATDPPGGKIHVIGEAVPTVARRVPAKRIATKKLAAQTASARKTVKAAGTRKNPAKVMPSVQARRPAAKTKKSAAKAKR